MDSRDELSSKTPYLAPNMARPGTGSSASQSRAAWTPSSQHALTGSYQWGRSSSGTPAGVQPDCLPGGAQEKPSRLAAHKKAILALIGLLVAVAVGLSVGLGVGLTRHSKSSDGVSAPSTGHGSQPLDPSGNDPSKITPLPFWNWADNSKKVLGVSVGGWLMLERWMYEDWFTQYAPNDWDEWHFTQTVGANASQLLSDHYDTFITEDEVETMYQRGINQLRIPIGFWSFIPVADGEPYVNSTQLFHLTRMMGWLWKRHMYAVIDLHGMPGSQSGDQSSGLNTSNPTWWTQENQNRSDQTLASLIDWLSYNPYKSVVSAISPVNEPNGVFRATPGNLNVTEAFYERSYDTLQKAGYSMFFHHGFATNPAQYWKPFATGKNGSMLVINDNPYPGWFPSVSNTTEINQRVCQVVTDYDGFPVPMVKTEFCVVSGPSDTEWNSQYYATQVAAYASGAGSFFWTFKTFNSTSLIQAEVPVHQMQYSFLQQIATGAIAPVGKGESVEQYISDLPNPACGKMAPTYNP